MKEAIHKAIDKLHLLIGEAHKIVVVGHVAPDGDAIGATLAFMHYLQLKHKRASVILPNAYPAFFAWMPGINYVVQYDFQRKTGDRLLDEADLIVCLDFNSLSRTGEAEEKLTTLQQAGKPIAMIDHHLDPDSGFTLRISNPVACATCEILYYVVKDSLNSNIAACLYTGLMMDTGAFTFNSTRPEIFSIVSDLLRQGIDKDRIYRSVYNQQSVGRMQLIGYAMYEKLKIYPTEHAALITLTQEELKRFGYEKGDTEGLVNMPLQIKDINLSCLLREDKTEIRVSLRSLDDLDTTPIASNYFSGGGHLNASGGKFIGTMDDAVKQWEKALKKTSIRK